MFGLKLSDVQPVKVADLRRRSAREIFLEAVENQIALLKNPDHVCERVRAVRGEDGTYTRKTVAKPPRKWWFEQGGQYFIQLHYGRTILELQAGKPTIHCGDIKGVSAALEKIGKALHDGDAKLEALIDAARVRSSRAKAE